MRRPQSQGLISILSVLLLSVTFSLESLAEIDKAEEQELMDKAYELAEEGKIEESAEILEKAASQGSRIAVYNLALLYEEAGDIEKAVGYYRKYLEDPLPSDTVAEIKKIRKHADNLASRPAEVTIQTDPQGSSVTDGSGKVLGTTPLTIELGPGEHELTFELEGYALETKTIGGGCAKKVLVEVKLVPENAAHSSAKPIVEISSNVEKANVLIDGTKVCETPCTTEQEPGEHKIEVESKGYEDFGTRVDLSPGDRKSIEANLSKTPGHTKRKDPLSRNRDRQAMDWCAPASRKRSVARPNKPSPTLAVRRIGSASVKAACCATGGIVISDGKGRKLKWTTPSGKSRSSLTTKGDLWT